MNKRFGINQKTIKNNSRSLNKKYYIFCDGEETEINYFKKFRNRKLKIEFHRIARSKSGCINEIENYLRTESVKIKDDVYSFWYVFDRDNFKDINTTIESAKKNNIYIAFSNPCIELWFYLHFNYIFCNFSASEIQNKLDNIFEKELKINYSKNDDKIYDYLKNNQEVAIKNAKKLEEYQKESSEKNIKYNLATVCPYTSVYKLVEDLNRDGKNKEIN